MFRPNVIGMLKKMSGRDVHSRITYSDPIECPFGVVNMNVGAEKTTVRADSSASRGSAEEAVAVRAKILIVPYVNAEIGDRFEFDGYAYSIKSKHVRRSVTGRVDHFECDLELLPE